MKEHIEIRWAFVCSLKGYSLVEDFFLGKYCWIKSQYDDQRIPTFRTRELARKAKKELRCYKNSRILKVEIIIRVKELKP